MSEKLTMQWGVVPGRQVGGITKRFHKTRRGTEAERAIAKSHGVTLREARRLLRFAQASNARKAEDAKHSDCLALEAERQRKIQAAKLKASQAEHDRAARVAAYLKSKEQ